MPIAAGRPSCWRGCLALALLLGLLQVAGAPSAAAEAARLRIGRAPGFAFLPDYIAEHERLVEKRAQSLGVPALTVEHIEFSGGNVMNGALLSGDLEVALGGVPPFLILWAKSRGTRVEVKALAAVSALPSVLLSRNPRVHGLRDLSDDDRISVAAVRASQVAILLEMACAQAFGPDQWGRLDNQTITMPQLESLAAMVSARSEITTHFTVPPYTYLELKSPSVHAILHSRDVLGGVGTVVVAYARTRFHDDNPRVMQALFGAMQDARDLISQEPRRAAAIYLEMTKEPLSVDEIVTLIRDPDLSYDLTPRATGTFANFMADIGSLSHKPPRWQDLFFEEAQGLPGS